MVAGAGFEFSGKMKLRVAFSFSRFAVVLAEGCVLGQLRRG